MALRDLVVNLIGRTDKFDKNMKKSGTVVERLKDRISDAGRSLVSFTAKVGKLGAAAGAVAAGAMVYFIRQEMNALDATAKLAAQIGLGSQALLEWQYAAGLGGVAGEEFSETIKEMNKRIGEAVTMQTGSAFEAFSQLGIDARELQRIGPDKALLRISDAISKVDSSAQQLMLADKIFGGAGTKLLPMLREGSAGIQGMRDEFRDLFGVMEEADFKAIEIANDQIAGVKVGIRGFIAQLTGQLAPAIAAIARRLKNWIKDIDIRAWAKSFTDMILTGAKYALGVLSQMKVAWLELNKGIQMVLGGLNKANAERLNLAATLDFSGSQKVYEDLIFRSADAETASRQNFANANNIDIQIRRSPAFSEAVDEWGNTIKAAMDEIKNEADALANNQKNRFLPGPESGLPEIIPPAIIKQTIDQVEKQIESPQYRVNQSLNTQTAEGFQALATALFGGLRDPNEDAKKIAKKTADEVEDLNRFMQTKLPGLFPQPKQVVIPV